MLKPGTLSDYSESMAEIMEQEFNKAWRQKNGKDLPEEGREDRRILFVAVARGVTLYLSQHQRDGFDVRVTDASGNMRVGDLDILVDD